MRSFCTDIFIYSICRFSLCCYFEKVKFDFLYPDLIKGKRSLVTDQKVWRKVQEDVITLLDLNNLPPNRCIKTKIQQIYKHGATLQSFKNEIQTKAKAFLSKGDVENAIKTLNTFEKEGYAPFWKLLDCKCWQNYNCCKCKNNGKF